MTNDPELSRTLIQEFSVPKGVWSEFRRGEHKLAEPQNEMPFQAKRRLQRLRRLKRLPRAQARIIQTASTVYLVAPSRLQVSRNYYSECSQLHPNE